MERSVQADRKFSGEHVVAGSNAAEVLEAAERGLDPPHVT